MTTAITSNSSLSLLAKAVSATRKNTPKTIISTIENTGRQPTLAVNKAEVLNRSQYSPETTPSTNPNPNPKPKSKSKPIDLEDSDPETSELPLISELLRHINNRELQRQETIFPG